MQVNRIGMIFVGLGSLLIHGFSLAQDSSNDFQHDTFHSKAEIIDHIELLEVFEDKFNSAIPTENGRYLLDINEASVSGAMVSLVFHRQLLQSGEGGYSIKYASGKGPLGLDLGGLGKEMNASQIRVRFENTAEGFLKQDQSFISFYTDRGYLIIGNGTPGSPNGQFMGNIERFQRGVSTQTTPSIKQIQFDTFFTTNFEDAEDIHRVLGGRGDGSNSFKGYASSLGKLKMGMIRVFPEEYMVAVRRVESTLSRPIEQARLANVLGEDLSRILSSEDSIRQNRLFAGLVRGLNSDIPGLPELNLNPDFRISRLLQESMNSIDTLNPLQRVMSDSRYYYFDGHRGRTIDLRYTIIDGLRRLRANPNVRGGVGGVLIGLGVIGGGLLLSADTVHASETNQANEEDTLPIYWTLTLKELEAYQEDIQSEKVFWSDFLEQQNSSSTTSMFGL